MSDRQVAMDFLAMDDLVDLIARATTDIQQQLERLERSAAELRPLWSGEAASAYDVAQRDWSTAMGRLHALLRQAESTVVDVKARGVAARAAAARLSS